MQKHWDVMRSDDSGDTWKEVSDNLPTDFGFPIDVHAHEPETIYVVPIKSDSEHYPLDGKLQVWRSRTGGNKWEVLTNGLPQKDCYVNVLRDAMSIDQLASQRLIAFGRGSSTRQIVDAALEGAGLRPRIALEANDLAFVRSLVARGIGIAILPRSFLERPGATIAFRPLAPPLRLSVVLWWRGARRLSPAAQAFVDFAAANRPD